LAEFSTGGSRRRSLSSACLHPWHPQRIHGLTRSTLADEARGSEPLGQVRASISRPGLCDILRAVHGEFAQAAVVFHLRPDRLARVGGRLLFGRTALITAVTAVAGLRSAFDPQEPDIPRAARRRPVETDGLSPSGGRAGSRRGRARPWSWSESATVLPAGYDQRPPRRPVIATVETRRSASAMLTSGERAALPGQIERTAPVTRSAALGVDLPSALSSAGAEVTSGREGQPGSSRTPCSASSASSAASQAL
jgi:hypothetical protein